MYLQIKTPYEIYKRLKYLALEKNVRFHDFLLQILIKHIEQEISLGNIKIYE